MMCYVHCFTPIGDHVRRTTRTIPLMYFVISLLGINISFLMKGNLVVNNKLTCLREKIRISTSIKEVPTILAPNSFASTKKLN